MEISFLILLLGFAASLLSAGGSWAHLALGAERRMYRGRELVALGLPALCGFGLALAALVAPAFDVEPGALIGAVVCSGLAVASGLRATPAAAVARGVLWPGAALMQAWATTQAIGIA